ncbi:hypothetical protein MRX96_013534 [Rhipicephalus microplus]
MMHSCSMVKTHLKTLIIASCPELWSVSSFQRWLVSLAKKSGTPCPAPRHRTWCRQPRSWLRITQLSMPRVGTYRTLWPRWLHALAEL